MGEVTRVTQGRSIRCWGPSHLFRQGVSPARLHPSWRCPASQLPGPGPAAARTPCPPSSPNLTGGAAPGPLGRGPAAGARPEGRRDRSGPRGVVRGGECHSPPPDTRTRAALRETTSDGDDGWAAARQWRRPALPASRGGPESAPEGKAGSNSERGDAGGVLAQDRANPAVSAAEPGWGRRTQPGL